MSTSEMPDVLIDADRMSAAVDLLRRTGAHEVQVRWSDDEQPLVWFVVAKWRVNRHGRPVAHGAGRAADTGAALDPVTAAERLLNTIVDGAECKHCGRPSGVTQDWTETMPLSTVICWYVYDPELKTYRRSCEGDADGV